MDPVAEYLASLGLPADFGSPAAPAPAGAAIPAPTAQRPPSTWETVLRAALPAVAGFMTARQGNLGTFTNAYQDSEQQFQRNQLNQQEFELRKQEEARRLHQEQIQMAELTAMNAARRRADLEKQQAAEQAALDKQAAAEKGDIQKSLDEAAKNPLLNTLINAFGTDAFSLKTPHGVMSLKDAQDKGAIIPGELGQPKLPTKPKPEKPTLITVPGPDGKPVRGIDKEGAKVYERPRAPKEPTSTASKRPSASVTRGEGPEMDKVTVRDPESQMTQTVSGSALLEKMKRAGIPEASYGQILRDPEALLELVRTY